MHIMHVIDSLDVLGGAERMLVELANRAAIDGYPVSVCITRSGAKLASELKEGIPLWILDRRWRFDSRALRLRSLIKEERVDLLHVHGRSSFSLLALMKSCGWLTTPIILHDHFGRIEMDHSSPWWFPYWASRHLAHFVGVYDKLADWARHAKIPEDRISVIENAIDFDRIQHAFPSDLRQEFGIEKETLIGVMVCNLRQEKGIDVLIQALAGSSFRNKVKMLIVGKEIERGYVQDCRTLASSLGLEKRVLFVGEQCNVANLLQGADFAVMASRSESGPLVLLEYMAAGLPFVSSLTGSIAQRISAARVPEFVPRNEVQVLADALDRLLKLTQAERTQRGKIGQDVALREFDIRRIMPKWYELYRLTLERS